MNVIFLDVDGVLNNPSTKDKIRQCRGIDDNKVLLLKEICDYCNAQIVLSSSWKDTWEKENKKLQDEFANYLDKKLKKAGLYILDKTKEDRWIERGKGIVEYVNNNNVDFWLVLDDEDFLDYYTEFRINNKTDKVKNHWINTGIYSCELDSYFYKINRPTIEREVGLTRDDVDLCKKLFDEYYKK